MPAWYGKAPVRSSLAASRVPPPLSKELQEVALHRAMRESHVAVLPKSRLTRPLGGATKLNHTLLFAGPPAEHQLPCPVQLPRGGCGSPCCAVVPALLKGPFTPTPSSTALQVLSLPGSPPHWQFAASTSLKVFGLPSSQGEPTWPGALGQLSCALQMPSPSVSGRGVPAQPQPACTTSLVVQGLPSLHGVPGLGPFTQGSKGLQMPSASLSAIGTPTQSQFTSHTSYSVQACWSLQGAPGRAVPFGVPWQSFCSKITVYSSTWPYSKGDVQGPGVVPNASLMTRTRKGRPINGSGGVVKKPSRMPVPLAGENTVSPGSENEPFRL